MRLHQKTECVERDLLYLRYCNLRLPTCINNVPCPGISVLVVCRKFCLVQNAKVEAQIILESRVAVWPQTLCRSFSQRHGSVWIILASNASMWPAVLGFWWEVQYAERLVYSLPRPHHRGTWQGGTNGADPRWFRWVAAAAGSQNGSKKTFPGWTIHCDPRNILQETDNFIVPWPNWRIVEHGRTVFQLLGACCGSTMSEVFNGKKIEKPFDAWHWMELCGQLTHGVCLWRQIELAKLRWRNQKMRTDTIFIFIIRTKLSFQLPFRLSKKKDHLASLRSKFFRCQRSRLNWLNWLKSWVWPQSPTLGETLGVVPKSSSERQAGMP